MVKVASLFMVILFSVFSVVQVRKFKKKIRRKTLEREYYLSHPPIIAV